MIKDVKMNKSLVYEDERVDDLHRNGYRIIQNPKKFCFGMDAVLLSGFAVIKQGETVLDLGTGTGIIPILLEAKTKGKKFIGLEIQEEMADMARRSVKLNQIENKVDIHQGDLKKVEDLYEPASFDVVTSNPPYMNQGGGLLNEHSSKAIARHELLCSLEDVIQGAARVLKNRGRLYMVHRPHRLPDLMVLLRKYKLEPKKMRMVYPYIHKEPNMVLLEAVKNGNPLLKNDPPLIVYEVEGNYTEEIYRIYGIEKGAEK
jgi:tRNA1(Val) A37 N6-methylase TrmN6